MGTKIFYTVVLMLSFALLIDGWGARLKKIRLLHKLEEGKLGDILDNLHGGMEASAKVQVSGTQRSTRKSIGPSRPTKSVKERIEEKKDAVGEDEKGVWETFREKSATERSPKIEKKLTLKGATLRGGGGKIRQARTKW